MAERWFQLAFKSKVKKCFVCHKKFGKELKVQEIGKPKNVAHPKCLTGK